jgi:hypothetical protein
MAPTIGDIPANQDIGDPAALAKITTDANGNPQMAGTSTQRYAKRLQTDENGKLVVAFPAGMFSKDVVPVIGVDVESPAGDTVYAYTYQILGPPTNTGLTIQVYRALRVPVISAIATLGLFTNPGAIWVHVRATTPTA